MQSMAIRILNNVDHKDLKVNIRSTRCGDVEHRALVFSTEYPDLHKHFPILIYKDPDSGGLSGHAVLGFEKGENLFIRNGEWQTPDIPATIARGPFSIGYRRLNEEGDEEPEVLIMIDEDDPRCDPDEGEAVFLQYGGETPYLRYIRKILKKIEIGMQCDKVFFALLEKYSLLEPVSIKVNLSAEIAVGFDGFNTINQDNLRELGAGALQSLNKAGVLGLVFFLTSSLDNFKHMIDMKNRYEHAG